MNPGPTDYDSAALTTELTRHAKRAILRRTSRGVKATPVDDRYCCVAASLIRGLDELPQQDVGRADSDALGAYVILFSGRTHLPGRDVREACDQLLQTARHRRVPQFAFYEADRLARVDEHEIDFAPIDVAEVAEFHRPTLRIDRALGSATAVQSK